MSFSFIAAFLALAHLIFQGIPFPGPGTPHDSGPVGTSKVCYNQPGGATNPVTCTWSASVAVGDTVHCWGNDSGSVPTFAVTDSGGNSYTNNGAVQNGLGGGLGYGQLFDSFSVANTATTATLTVTAVTVSFAVLFCFVSTGGTGATDGALGFNFTTGAATIAVSVSPSTTTALMECFGQMYAGGVTMGVGSSGFTQLAGSASNITGGYLKLSASGSHTATWTMSNSVTPTDMICAAYK